MTCLLQFARDANHPCHHRDFLYGHFVERCGSRKIAFSETFEFARNFQACEVLSKISLAMCACVCKIITSWFRLHSHFYDRRHCMSVADKKVGLEENSFCHLHKWRHVSTTH